MKIIDVNMTVGGRDSAGKQMDFEGLLDLMRDYRIDHCVCYHQHALLDPKDGNAKMAELAARSDGKLSVCAVLDPILGAENLPGTGALKERLLAWKPACLRIFPEAVRLPFHPVYWSEILETADALHMPLLIDCPYNEVFLCTFPQICAQYPHIKFVLLREGCCQGRRIFPLLQKRNNVYFTIERMLDYMQLEEIAEKTGCDRLLFGSGYPERPHAGALGLVMYAGISEEDRQKILYGNWEEMQG